jgi:hypothetical protein
MAGRGGGLPDQEGLALLLFVALDDLRVPDLRAIGVLSELAPRPPLPQEIPALVELDLERLMALVILGRMVALAVESMLLVDEVLNTMQNALVVHGTSAVLYGIRAANLEVDSLESL